MPEGRPDRVPVASCARYRCAGSLPDEHRPSIWMPMGGQALDRLLAATDVDNARGMVAKAVHYQVGRHRHRAAFQHVVNH